MEQPGLFFASEAEIYTFLGLEYQPPHLRNA